MDDVTRGKVLPGGLVRGLGELADQLLEHHAHGEVIQPLGAEVGAGEALDDGIEDVGGIQPVDEFLELEVVEDFLGLGAEALDVVHQVLAGLGLRQRGQAQRGGVVELEAGGVLQHPVARALGLALGLGGDLQDLVPRRLQHALEAPQDGKGQDHPAVLGLLERAAEEVCHAPEERREVILVHSSPFLIDYRRDGP